MAPAILRSKSILLVEDDSDLRTLLVRVLRGANYEVAPCASGEEALATWEQTEGAFTLALVDLTLPGNMGGREFAAWLRREAPKVEVILMSGDLPHFDQALGWMQSFVFLQKPFLPSELLRIIREAFARAGIQSEGTVTEGDNDPSDQPTGV